MNQETLLWLLQEPTRLRILRAIQTQRDDKHIRGLARQLGLYVNVVQYHIRLLEKWKTIKRGQEGAAIKDQSTETQTCSGCGKQMPASPYRFCYVCRRPLAGLNTRRKTYALTPKGRNMLERIDAI